VIDGADALEKAIDKDAFREWLKGRGVEIAVEA
jgi:hypothetical protein